MVNLIIRTSLSLVLIIVAHMVVNGSSHSEVIGIVGSNITLIFRFNVSITKKDHFAVYRDRENKIFESLKGRTSQLIKVCSENSSIAYHMSNLDLNDSSIYWATLFNRITKHSDKVTLTIKEQNRTTTASPKMTNATTSEESGSHNVFPFHIIILMVVLLVVLLAAVLPWFICFLSKTKDEEQQEHPHQRSNPTVSETVDAPRNMPAPTLVYSVLDFPKKSPAVMAINPRDTEYAAVSYLPEKRQIP
ncbi:uncharacterized protein KZ484_006121 isoform 1-T1 [Pholidichthys leucotaenia]